MLSIKNRMFDIKDIINYLTILAYVGFTVSGISGLIKISKEFNFCYMIISILSIYSSALFCYCDLSNKLVNIVTFNQHYLKALYLFIMSFLIIGLSPIGIGFGIWGLLMTFSNVFFRIV